MASCGYNRSPFAAEGESQSLLTPANEASKIKYIIAVGSGKGGVGKSLVTTLVALGLVRRGYRVGILDGDVTGPSIPKMLGVTGKVTGQDNALIPPQSKEGIRVISANLLLPHTTDPIAWRGPLIAGLVQQFWTDVVWDVDYLLVDMPPGTGDVPLTIYQSLPLDGALIVTTPQEVVSLIVQKALNFTQNAKVPLLGIIENMSYVACPRCGEQIAMFGASNPDFAEQIITRIPLLAELATAADRGDIKLAAADFLEPVLDILVKIPLRPTKIAVLSDGFEVSSLKNGAAICTFFIVKGMIISMEKAEASLEELEFIEPDIVIMTEDDPEIKSVKYFTTGNIVDAVRSFIKNH